MGQKGRGLCPFCGSPEIYYNEHFESWRCSKCEKSFPSPSYGSGSGEPRFGRTRYEYIRSSAKDRISKLTPTDRDGTVAKRRQSSARRNTALRRWLNRSIVLLVLVAAGVSVWHYWGDDIATFFRDLSETPAAQSEDSSTAEVTGSSDTAVGSTTDEGTTTGEEPIASNLTVSEELVQSTFELINAERIAYGLTALEFDATLAALASEHSDEMVQYDYFSHDRMPGSRDFMWGTQAGFGRGENISMVPERRTMPGILLTAEEIAAWAVSGWMNSPGHRENILTGEFTRTGIGVAYRDGYYYITQIFEGYMY